MRLLNHANAALLGGIFYGVSIFAIAQVPIVKSQADHVASAGQAIPLTPVQAQPAVSSELIGNLVFQMQDMQALVAEQRGLIEELSYQLDVLQKEQKERYVDLDRRIVDLKNSPSIPVAQNQEENLTPSEPVESVSAVSDEEILALYNQATALMQAREFDEAVSQLTQFSELHSEHPLAANAYYWVGEVSLVQRNVSQAQLAFEQVVNQYSQHEKVPDSLYKLGVIAQQAGELEKSRSLFDRVVAEFPDTQSAKLAAARRDSE